VLGDHKGTLAQRAVAVDWIASRFTRGKRKSRKTTKRKKNSAASVVVDPVTLQRRVTREVTSTGGDCKGALCDMIYVVAEFVF